MKTQTRHGRARPCFNYLRHTFNRRICLTPQARSYSHLPSASSKIFHGHVDKSRHYKIQGRASALQMILLKRSRTKPMKRGRGTACHVPDTRSSLRHCNALSYMPHRHVEQFGSTFVSLCVPNDSVDSITRGGTVCRTREA